MVWKAWILELTLGWIFLHFSTGERGMIVSFFALNLSDLGLVLCGTVVANSPSTKHLFSVCGSPL